MPPFLDRDAVLAAVRRRDRTAWQSISEELRADREVVMEAVRQDSWALQWASPELRADREVVSEAMKQCGQTLEFASEELRADREVVLEAVKTCGCALQYASKELRHDLDVVLAAMRNDHAAVKHAGRIRTIQWLLAAAVSNLAAEGETAPVVNIERAIIFDNVTWGCSMMVIACTLGGAEVVADIGMNSSMDDLAFNFAHALGNWRARVHLVFPGHGHVSPGLFTEHVRDYMQFSPSSNGSVAMRPGPPQQQQSTSEEKQDHDVSLTQEQIQFKGLLKRARHLAPPNGIESKEFVETMGQLAEMMEGRIQQLEGSEAEVVEHSPAAAASTPAAVLDRADAAMAALEAFFIKGPAAANAVLDAAIGRGQR